MRVIRNITGKTNRIASSGMAAALLLGLFGALPLFGPGLPHGADSPIHVYRAAEFARAWSTGVLYPRWAPTIAHGYGYPLFLFAPPLPHVVPLLVHLLGAEIETGVKVMLILSAAGYGLGPYLWLRRYAGQAGGLIAAAVYALAPFALRELLLRGGNYPQYVAIGLFPWLMWGISMCYGGRARAGLAVTALSYAGIMCGHLFHALAITPVALGYVAVLHLSHKPGGRTTAGVLGLVFGLGLGAFFWVPAYFERTVTRAQAKVYLHINPISNHFLELRELFAPPRIPDVSSANPYIPLGVSLAALALAAAGIAAAITRSRGRPALHTAVYFAAVAAVSMAFTLPFSLPAWERLPFIAVAQFPWRLLGMANLSLACLAGMGAAWLSPAWSDRRRAAVTCAAICIVYSASAPYLWPLGPSIRYGNPTTRDVASYELTHGTIGLTTLGEYLPLWVRDTPKTSPLVPALLAGEDYEKLDADSLPPGASASLLDHTPVEDTYMVDTPVAARLRFFTFYFPGWQATVDGEPARIGFGGKDGLIRVEAPPGRHEVSVRFVETPPRLASDAVTLAAVVALAVLLFAWPKDPARETRARGGAWGTPVTLVVAGLIAVNTLLVVPTGLLRRESPPGEAAFVGHETRVNLEDRVLLIGYDLDKESVKQGETLHVTLYWLARQKLDANYRSFAHLDAPHDGYTWAASDNWHPGNTTTQAEVPTSTWDTTHYVRDTHKIKVPEDMPPVTLQLRVGLYERDTGRRLQIAGGEGGDTIFLQDVEIVPARPLTEAALEREGATIVNASCGDGRLTLVAYRAEVNTRAIVPWLNVALYWRAEEKIERDYTVFLHLNQRGQLAIGQDGPPLAGLHPSSGWRIGETFPDYRRIILRTLHGGEYSLTTGLYDPATMERLRCYLPGRSEPVDEIDLGRIDF